MRTTVTIEDGIYRRAKAHAALSGQSVGSVVEEALRSLLDTVEGPDEVAELPVAGRGGVRPGVDLSDNASVRAILDEGHALDALR